PNPFAMLVEIRERFLRFGTIPLRRDHVERDVGKLKPRMPVFADGTAPARRVPKHRCDVRDRFVEVPNVDPDVVDAHDHPQTLTRATPKRQVDPDLAMLTLRSPRRFILRAACPAAVRRISAIARPRRCSAWPSRSPRSWRSWRRCRRPLPCAPD